MAQRVAVVTGGMGGLGEAICIKLSKMGFTVVTTYSPGNKKSAEWLAEMKKEGHSFHAVPADVADFVVHNMPPNEAGSLTPDEYWAILAFDLHANGINLDRKLSPDVARTLSIPR